MDYLASVQISEKWTVTVSGTIPLPHMDDLIDSVDPAMCITTLDLLKGDWKISLTQLSLDISAFVMQDTTSVWSKAVPDKGFT